MLYDPAFNVYDRRRMTRLLRLLSNDLTREEGLLLGLLLGLLGLLLYQINL